MLVSYLINFLLFVFQPNPSYSLCRRKAMVLTSPTSSTQTQRHGRMMMVSYKTFCQTISNIPVPNYSTKINYNYYTCMERDFFYFKQSKYMNYHLQNFFTQVTLPIAFKTVSLLTRIIPNHDVCWMLSTQTFMLK